METPDSWQLDDDSEQSGSLPLTTRAAKKMGWVHTYHAQFRCPLNLYEMIEQFVSKHPAYKTKSEFFVDAAYQHLDKLLKEQPDGFNGIVRTQHFLDNLKLERATRELALETAKEELDRLQQSGDVARLRSYMKEMQMMFSDLLMDAPESFTDEIDKLIQKAKRLIQAAAVR
jgi:hypothetical protein